MKLGVQGPPPRTQMDKNPRSFSRARRHASNATRLDADLRSVPKDRPRRRSKRRSVRGGRQFSTGRNLRTNQLRPGQCPYCKGEGYVEQFNPVTKEISEMDCRDCGGTGKAGSFRALDKNQLKQHLPTIIITLLLIGVIVFVMLALRSFDPGTISPPTAPR